MAVCIGSNVGRPCCVIMRKSINKMKPTKIVSTCLDRFGQLVKVGPSFRGPVPICNSSPRSLLLARQTPIQHVPANRIKFGSDFRGRRLSVTIRQTFNVIGHKTRLQNLPIIGAELHSTLDALIKIF